MKIQYWIVTFKSTNATHFSITGEGDIEDECLKDATLQAEKFISNSFTIQKVAVIN